MNFRIGLIACLMFALFASVCASPANAILPKEKYEKAMAAYRAKINVKLKVEMTALGGNTAEFTVKEIEQVPENLTIKVGDKIDFNYRVSSGYKPYTKYIPGPIAHVIEGKTAKDLRLEAVYGENLFKDGNSLRVKGDQLYPPVAVIEDYLKHNLTESQKQWKNAEKLIEDGKYEESLKFWTEIITADPRRASAYKNFGICLAKLKRHQDAIVAFEKAIELQPRFPEVYRALASTYEECGQPEKAAEVREKEKNCKFKAGSIFKD